MKNKPQEKLYQSDIDSNTIFDRIIKYVNSKYRIRFNTISLDYEINIIGHSDWESLNINSLLIELTRNSIDTNYNKLETLLKSNLIERYDPIKEYMLELPKWDNQVDYIKHLASFVTTNDNEAFIYHLKKWFARAVICACEKDKINKKMKRI